MKKTLYLITLSLACAATTHLSHAFIREVVGGTVGAAAGAVRGVATGVGDVVEGTVEGARTGVRAARGEYTTADSQDLGFWEITNDTHHVLTVSSDTETIQLNPKQMKKLDREEHFNFTVKYADKPEETAHKATFNTDSHFVTVYPRYHGRLGIRKED